MAQPHQLATKWAEIIGGGFHPDTRGKDYTPPLSEEQIAEYDNDMDALFEVAADPYKDCLDALIIATSDRELAALIDEYEAWNKAQGLKLGSADEHMFDESLTEEQRKWLRDYVNRWEDSELLWGHDGPKLGRDVR